MAPAVLVRAELHDRRLQEYCVVPELYEDF
jgi:hypothetical protein